MIDPFPAEGSASWRGPSRSSEPSLRTIVLAVATCLAFSVLTRLPVARPGAFDFDEVGYLETIREGYFPKQHTLFLAAGRLAGEWCADPYRGFVLLDVLTSGLAMAGVWWLLRGLVPPKTAMAGTLVVGVGPVFWAYGAMAANYTAIPLVGSLLLGIAWRGRTAPRPWHPLGAAVAMAMGAGYRQDIGLFWMPVFLAILWRHRWIAAIQAGMLFILLDLAWFIPMLRDAGGWALYRAETGRFAHNAGYLNSVWYLGPIDATSRYVLKAAMALGWTLGLGLLFVPRGLVRLARRDGGPYLIGLMVATAMPALAMHLLVHFGVAGYSFHYLPSLVVLMAMGFGPATDSASAARDRVAARRGLAISATLAAVFLFYPTDYRHPGFRGDFDLSCGRHTRIGLATRPPLRDPDTWRTASSQRLPENLTPRPDRSRTLMQILGK